MSDNTSATLKQMAEFIARWRGHGGIAEDASNLMVDATGEIERLRKIIDSRPAINAALPESYIKWSQSIYELDAVQAGAIPKN